MTVNQTYTDPSTSGGLDLSTGDVLTETVWDKVLSNIKAMGGTANEPTTLAWTPVWDTWTYASATTITVPSGAAAIYSIGDKIKFTQTTVKYFYIVGVADTVLTVTGGTDYAVATPTAISSIYYSKASTPVGFPASFNWTGASGDNPQGFTGAITDATVFRIDGRVMTIIPSIVGTSNATTFTFTAPAVAAVSVSAPTKGRDNGTLTLCQYVMSASSATVTLYKDSVATTAFTNSGTKGLYTSPIIVFI